jgi:hypothetical protein
MGHTCEAEELRERWLSLCASYLPLVAGGSSIWRYNRAPTPDEPTQGWKLHVSATVLNAPALLARIAPPLTRSGVRFKAPSSLDQLAALNSGISYGYTQVGKIFTVYPRTEGEAIRLARSLHGLTRGLPAPAVPFDLQFRPDSNVFYRYGAHDSFEVELPNGRRVPAIRDPDGNPVPDPHESAKPEWVEDPFQPHRKPRCNAPHAPGPLASFHIFRALTQRGKGGVYQALNLCADPPRLCILKEGRKNGEVTWDGRDGRWRVRNEERALSSLKARGVEVPLVYDSFESDENYYLAIEFIEGETLLQFLGRRARRLPVSRVLHYGLRVATLLARIHGAGWVWGDCKPSNLLITRGGGLRPLDFEGACPVGCPDPVPWATPAFSRPGPGSADARVDDLYALGATIYLLLTGRMPETPSAFVPASTLRRNTPTWLCRLVSDLLSLGVRDARSVAQRLSEAL